MKISLNSRVRSTNEISDIYNTLDKIFLVFTENVGFFYFSLWENFRKTNRIKISCFPSHISIILLDSACLFGYNTESKHSLHMENGL